MKIVAFLVNSRAESLELRGSSPNLSLQRRPGVALLPLSLGSLDDIGTDRQ